MNKRTTQYMAFNRLIEFLSNHRNDTGITHTSSVHPKGAFHIVDNDLDQFYEIYNKVLEEGGDLYLTEMCEPEGSPFKVDIDIKFKVEQGIELGLLTADEGETEDSFSINKGHYYELDHVKKLLFFIKQMLEEVTDLSKLDVPLYAVILEKERVSKKQNGQVGDGFHIVFPYLSCDYALQHFVRNRIIQPTTFGKVFGDLIFSNEPDDIYDKGIIERNWTLYGSKGKRSGPLYAISHIYELEKEKVGFNNLIVRDINITDLTETERNNLPKFLSIRGKPVNVVYKSDELKALITELYKTKFEKRKKQKIEPIKEVDEDLEFIRKLIKLISPKRSEGYEEWIRVGWCLHNIDPKNLLDDFIDFSKQTATKFQPGACEKVWDTAKDDGLGIGTLHFWARTDSPEEYTKLLAEDITRNIESIPQTHVGIAEIMRKMYEQRFVCIHPEQSLNKREWFQFQDHRWVANAVCSLRGKIYKDLIWCFNKVQYKLDRLRNLEDTKSNDRKDLFKIKNSKTDKIKTKLETSSFIDSVIKECGYKLHNPKFMDMANKNSDIIAFNNGVFDLSKMIFREGLPEDYITMSTGIDYNPDTPEIKEVKKFLKEILPNKKVREYALYYMATCLHGENEQQKLLVFTGEGGNGKSLLIQLLEDSLGDYTCALDVGYVTQKRQRSSQASPGVMELRGRRLGVIHEPDEGDTLNMGIVKALTGNDKIKARNLFENDITFRNKAKLIMLCNALPTPSSQDDGVWRRIRAVHFPIQFVDNPTEENERKKDITLDTKIPKWRQAFINLLIAYYYKLKTQLNGVIPEPEEVRDFTNEYRQRTNIFLEFVNESITKVKDEDPLQTSSIYNKFRSWYSDSYPGTKCVPKKELQDYLKKTYKKEYTIKYGLKGYGFKEEIEVEMEDAEESNEKTKKGKKPKDADLLEI